MLRNNAYARWCSYFELGLPVLKQRGKFKENWNLWQKNFSSKESLLWYFSSWFSNQGNSDWLFYYRIKGYHPQEKYSKHWAILTSIVIFRKNSFWKNLQCIKNPNNNFKGLLCESHIILVRHQNHARIWWAMGSTLLNCLYSSQLPSKIKSPFRSLSLSVSSELANSLIC